MRRIVALSLLISCALGSYARADDDTNLLAKTRAARSAVRSMQMAMSSSTDRYPISMTLTVSDKGQFHEVDTSGPLMTEQYGVGDGFMYLHIPGTKIWQKSTMTRAALASLIAQLVAPSVVQRLRALPDRVEGGTPVGMYAAYVRVPPMWSMAQGGPDQTLTCSYDKKSYLLKSCTDGTFTLTYSRYNDPTLAVELPPESKTAILTH